MQDAGISLERQIEFYQRKYELSPHSRAFAPLADLYRKAGRLDEALEVLTAGLAEHPQYVSALVILGRCHLDAGRPPGAAEAFARVLGLDPDNLVALKQLAAMASEEGRDERALELLERVVVLDPTDEDSAARLEALRGGPPAAAPAVVLAEADGSPGDEPAFASLATATEATAPGEAAAVAEPPAEAPAAWGDVALPEGSEPVAPAPTSEDAPAPTPPAPAEAAADRHSFATRTLAEIYLAQGYRDKALSVLREILARHPERGDVAAKIAEIESLPPVGAEPRGGESAPAPAAAGAPGAASPSRGHFEAWLERLARPEENR